MRYIAIFLAIICFGLIKGQRNRTNSGPEKCGDFEIPAPEKGQKDHFCRPSYTPSWELEKPRRCVCKKGYVRNSWGECISKTHCWSCKLRRYKDWHTCASGCPATCGQPLETSCRKKCKPRCECPPGFVVHPKYSSKCVKADTCPPKCPRNSSFKPCVSNCEPKCNGERPEKCVSRCDTGGCVCNKGYAYFVRNRQRICVLESACALYAPPPLSFTSKEIESSGRGEGSHDRANGPGGAARRSERTRSRGGQTGPDENLSLGIPRPGPAGGMPGFGGAAHGESEETGHPPFARGPAGALPHAFRESTPPPGTEGHFRAGTGPNPMRNVSTPVVGPNIHSFRAASRLGLGAVGAGIGVLGAGGMLSRGSERHGGAGRGVLGAGSLLSRGSEGHGGAGIGIQPSGTPSHGGPGHRGSSDESSEGPHPPAPGGLGGLGAGIERVNLLPSSTENHLRGEAGIHPEGNRALGTTGPGRAGINLHPEGGQPHGTLGLGGAVLDESEESAPFAGAPGTALPDVFRTYPQPPGIEGPFPTGTGVMPPRSGSFGAIGPRGRDVDINLFGGPPRNGLREVEGGIEGLREEARFSRPSGLGGDGIVFRPSSTTSRVSPSIGGTSSEESGERTQPSASDVPGRRTVGIERVGTPLNSTEGHRPRNTESRSAGNHSLGISRNETGAARVSREGLTPGGSEGFGRPNSGESEEISTVPSNARLGGDAVGIGTGYHRVFGSGSDLPYGAGTYSFGTPLFGREGYGEGAVGGDSVGASSHDILGYRGGGVRMHGEGTPSHVGAGYRHPGFRFYPPGTITRSSAEVDETGLNENGEDIHPPLSMGSRMSGMLMRQGSRQFPGIEGHVPAGVGLYPATRLPFDGVPVGRGGMGINSEVASRMHRQSGYGGASVEMYREGISSSPIGRYGGGSSGIHPFGFGIPGRAAHGREEFDISRGDATSRATTGYDRERLMSFLLRTRTPALARHMYSGFRLLPRTETSGFRARSNGHHFMSDHRDSPLGATTELGDDSPGLYHGRTPPRDVSGYRGPLPHLQREGPYIPRNAEYEMARLGAVA